MNSLEGKEFKEYTMIITGKHYKIVAMKKEV